MDGNRHKATAQRMPSGEKQDWGDQPLSVKNSQPAGKLIFPKFQN